MGFMSNSHWFQTMLRGMSTFNQCFKGNVPLGDISPLSSSAAMIRFIEIRVSPIQNAFFVSRNSLNKASYSLVFDSYGVSACSSISSDDHQDAQVAQVNVSSPDAFDNDLHIGDIGVTHFGDVWQLPDMFRTNRADLTPQFTTMVCSPAYFQDPS